MIFFHSRATSCLSFFFFVRNKFVNTKEAISTYDKNYIEDDGVAELCQLQFCCLQISFCIKKFLGHSLQITHGQSVLLLNILFCTLYLYCMAYILHYSASQIMSSLNTGRCYRGPNVVLPLNFKSYGSGEL